MSKTNTAQRIIDLLSNTLDNTASLERLTAETALSASTIQKAVKPLIEAGKIIRTGKGVYALPAPAKKASKAKTPRGESLSSFIRASLIDQGDDRKLVLAAAKAKFPNLKPTMGLVNWIAKKMGEQREEFQA